MTGRGEYFGKSDGLVSPKDLAFYGKPVKHCYEFGKKQPKPYDETELTQNCG